MRAAAAKGASVWHRRLKAASIPLLPRHNRLGRADIETILRRGRRLETLYTRLYLKPGDKPERLRLAVVVGKRVAKSAVVRHRLTRQLRSAALACLPKRFTAYDMVLVAKPTAAAVHKQQDFLEDLRKVTSQ